ncbi:MAG TPA: HlyD family efflux transporter periplasmic adaptor subunit [Puia sp.]|nr:HlyD family efflux transporter periplasmic adaptor subunit [Puia sp.]
MLNAIIRYRLVIILLIFTSCANKAEVSEVAAEPVQTPVTVTGITKEPLEEFIELNATSTYLLKNYIKANANGYLQSAHVMPGQFVKAGQTLFTIKTKESESIGNAVNKLDTAFKFSGTNSIKTSAGGFISQVNHQSGDYVQDGEQLAVISDESSFVFIMELPYELKPYVKPGSGLELKLPDGEKLQGLIASFMPTVESTSQTQNVVIRVKPAHSIPENLLAKVIIPKIIRDHSVSLPRAAVLSDETQTQFWVMKMTDSITAIKIPIKKGIETKDRIEILSPSFSEKDRILLTGNYGLSDTAKVRIVQPQ